MLNLPMYYIYFSFQITRTINRKIQWRPPLQIGLIPWGEFQMDKFLKIVCVFNMTYGVLEIAAKIKLQ